MLSASEEKIQSVPLLESTDILSHIQCRINFLKHIWQEIEKDEDNQLKSLYEMTISNKKLPFNQASAIFFKNQIQDSIKVYERLKGHLEKNDEKDKEFLANFSYIYLTNFYERKKYELSEHVQKHSTDSKKSKGKKIFGETYQQFKKNNLFELEVIPAIIEELIQPHASQQLVNEINSCTEYSPIDNFSLNTKSSSDPKEVDRFFEKKPIKSDVIKDYKKRLKASMPSAESKKTIIAIFNKMFDQFIDIKTQKIHHETECIKLFLLAQQQFNSDRLRELIWEKIATMHVAINKLEKENNEILHKIKYFVDKSCDIVNKNQYFFFNLIELHNNLLKFYDTHTEITNMCDDFQTEELKDMIHGILSGSLLSVLVITKFQEEHLSPFDKINTYFNQLDQKSVCAKIETILQALETDMRASQDIMSNFTQELIVLNNLLDRILSVLQSEDKPEINSIPSIQNTSMPAQFTSQVNSLVEENKPIDSSDTFDMEEHVKKEKELTFMNKQKKMEIKRLRSPQSEEGTHAIQIKEYYRNRLSHDGRDCLIKLFDPETKVSFAEIEKIISEIGQIDESRNGSRRHFSIQGPNFSEKIEVLQIKEQNLEAPNTKVEHGSLHRPKDIQEKTLPYVKKAAIDLLERAQCNPRLIFPEYYEQAKKSKIT